MYSRNTFCNAGFGMDMLLWEHGGETCQCCLTWSYDHYVHHPVVCLWQMWTILYVHEELLNKERGGGTSYKDTDFTIWGPALPVCCYSLSIQYRKYKNEYFALHSLFYLRCNGGINVNAGCTLKYNQFWKHRCKT